MLFLSSSSLFYALLVSIKSCLCEDSPHRDVEFLEVLAGFLEMLLLKASRLFFSRHQLALLSKKENLPLICALRRL